MNRFMNRWTIGLSASALVIFFTAFVVFMRARGENGGSSITSGMPSVKTASSPAEEQKRMERILAFQDSDGDGLFDTAEQTIGTNPLNSDTDGDGVADGAEHGFFHSDPLKKNTSAEFEALLQTLPDSPLKAIWMATHQPLPTAPPTAAVASTSSAVATSTAPPITPALSVLDSDRDGLSDEAEARYGTDVNKPDTDGDSLLDGDEVTRYGTNSLKADTDGDGYPDGTEIEKGYNPLGSGKCPKLGCSK